MSTRCYVPADTEYPHSVCVDGPTAHHIARVLRMASGDKLELFNGVGRVADATIERVAKLNISVTVHDQWLVPMPQPKIILVQALIRPQPMDWVIRKATELGIQQLQPVLTEHCVVRTRERPERWNKTIISAAEQCGANWLPTIAPVRTWSDWLHTCEGTDALYMGSLSSGSQPLRTALRAYATPPKSVAVLIGPEGDFSQAEQQAAEAAGVVPVSLGALTLRAETAALMMLAALRYEFDGLAD